MTDLLSFEQAYMRLRSQLRERDDLQSAIMVGIHSGGHWLAQRLHTELGLTTPLAALNIAFYRDDFARIGLHPVVTPTRMPLSLEDRNVILVDDVLQTGRTVRAAMNELFDYGRPARIVLAVLVDRGGRELPIAADVTGMKLTLPVGQHVKLARQPDGVLSLELEQSGAL